MTLADSPPVARPLRGWRILGACSVVFVASAAASVYLCDRPACCTSVRMAGDWSMSKMWMPSPDHGWAGSFAMFLFRWVVMMVAMMLPSLTPVLVRCDRPARVACGYFLVWTIFGAIAYPLGAVLASVTMHHESLSRAVPMLTAAALLLAGLIQWTSWKTHRVTCCRAASSGTWGAGFRLGINCVECCLAIMVFMLLAGAMELRVMLITTVIITAERVLPRPVAVARITGAMMIIAGAYLAFLQA